MQDTQVSSEVEEVEKELKQSSERFRRSKVQSTTADTEAGPPRPPLKTNAKRLTFQNVEAIAVKKKGVRQEILKKVCGVARPGQLTFIMGSSGAGKTTLLNILTGRNLKSIETDGEVVINGRNMTFTEMKRLSAYVQQDDVFIGMLTVKETLRFAAKLRSPHKLDKNELDSIVDELLVMMSLKKCENTKVGSMTDKSLSRGERKRLAFACEILTDPPILFCDEPTSGLDSFMSHQVIKALRQLTYEGKTVVCTIHQPSTSVYQMADQLILLSQGHVAYAGPANQVDAFFGRCGYPIPKYVSSPDHFMRVISHKSFESEEEYNKRIEKIVQEHEKEKSSYSSTHSSRREQAIEDMDSFPRTWWCQFFYIFHRSAVQLYRERAVLLVKLIQVGPYGTPIMDL
uniref:ABC transporter domain-containing protein n=1 Tax=Caenorhabditis tropicalis TaxID=1561998 RepID=A0A1I7U8R7_9PELO